MRAPFQILAIPYRVTPELQFCVFHRADIDQYQFVAGGGENDEKPVDAAIREICEERCAGGVGGIAEWVKTKIEKLQKIYQHKIL